MISELAAPFIICEIGSNWCRYETQAENKECALAHIRAAAACGAHAAKFQYFKTRELFGYDRADWQRFELPEAWLSELKAECDKAGIEFMCSAFSVEGFGVVDRYVNIHKVASSSVLNRDIFKAVTEFKKPILFSIGAISMDEFGQLDLMLQTCGTQFNLLQCVAAYPAKAEDYNLKFIKALHRNRFSVGISDHTRSEVAALVAIGCGATVFEKHFEFFDVFDLNQGGMKTPDSPHSANYQEMRNYVAAIKQGYAALGDGIKRVMPSEEYLTKSFRRTGVVEK